MADRKDRMALLSRFNKLYTQKFGTKAGLNLNVEQWAADALIESYGLQGCYDLLEYYFKVAQSPTWNYFAYNAQDVGYAKMEQEMDLKERAERRAMARRWLSD